jgi:hypothetical protein
MSIRILLDHGVKEEHIVFVTFLVARNGGVSTLRRAFPKVKIVCAEVDDDMEEGWLEGVQDEVTNPDGVGRKVWFMQPGMGQIGKIFLILSFEFLVWMTRYLRRGSLLSVNEITRMSLLFVCPRYNRQSTFKHSRNI